MISSKTIKIAFDGTQEEWDAMPYNEYIKIQKGNLIEILGQTLSVFIEECANMAVENWCQSQVDDLQRLFIAVCTDTDYAEKCEEDEPEEERKAVET